VRTCRRLLFGQDVLYHLTYQGPGLITALSRPSTGCWANDLPSTIWTGWNDGQYHIANHHPLTDNIRNFNSVPQISVTSSVADLDEATLEK
jgi:hypothetical protein